MVKVGWQAKRSPLPLLEYRQHSRYQTNIQLGSFIELQFYKNLSKEIRSELERSHSQVQQIQSNLEQSQSELERSQSQLQQTQSELEKLQSQLQDTQSELERSQNNILAMESSKFWKLRRVWFTIKHKLRFAS